MKKTFSMTNALIIAGIALFLAGCSLPGIQPSAPLASPPASAFLLGIDVFPKRWAYYSDEKGEIVARRFFGIRDEPGQAFQEVYRRSNDQEASEKYKVYLEGEFSISKER